MLLVGFADPFFQRAHRHIQIIGGVLNAGCASLPDFAQGLPLGVKGMSIFRHKWRSNADHPRS
jgi:hypothetical protein